VDHLNVYSRGRTELGRLLSNFAHTPFVVPLHGEFASVEAYWYWLQCTDPVARERLRHLSGFAAKRAGRALRVPDYGRANDAEFRRCIARAIREKIWHTPGLAARLHACTLPLTHYYVYGAKVVTPPGNEWILEAIDYYRAKLQTPVAAAA
jgi:hypothetical protein